MPDLFDAAAYIVPPTPLISLRVYQDNAAHQCRALYKLKWRSILLIAPTGAGKTVIACHLMQEAHAKGTKTLFLCDRIDLVEQTSKMLAHYGIPHGVIMAKHWRNRPDELIQVCSVQTLERWETWPRGIRLLVVDEAHCMRDATRKFIDDESNKSMRVLGMTATPFTPGLGEIYQERVNTITMNELIAMGYLAPIRIFAAKEIDMTGAKTNRNGEWSDKQVEERGRVIYGDIVDTWRTKCPEILGLDAPKTLVWAPSLAYGTELARRFQAHGFNFQQISYKDHNPKRRAALIEEFRKPDSTVTGLIACEVFTKGFDVPDVLVGIAARPYKNSFAAHLQQLGRVARPFPGKEFALWLDHSGNARRYNDDTCAYYEKGLEGLDMSKLALKKREEPSEEEKAQMVCTCGFILPPMCEQCPACGKERRRRPALIKEKAATMEELGKPGQRELQLHTPIDWVLTWDQAVSLAYQIYPDDEYRRYRRAYSIWTNYSKKMGDPQTKPYCRVFEARRDVPVPDELRDFAERDLKYWRIRMAKGRAKGRAA